MAARFLMYTPTQGRDADKPTEYIEMPNGNGKDMICRPANDADRAKYAEEYAAFTGAAAPQAPTGLKKVMARVMRKDDAKKVEE